MKANEDNFVRMLKQRKEEGILYVIETYGGLIRSIVLKRLARFPDRAEECMNDVFWGYGRISIILMKRRGVL